MADVINIHNSINNESNTDSDETPREHYSRDKKK